MAVRVAATTGHLIGAAPAGFASDVKGATIFAWMRRDLAGDGPRVGLVGASASRFIANNNGGALRGVLTDAAAVTQLPAAAGSGVVGQWCALGVTMRDIGASRTVQAFSQAGPGTPLSSAISFSAALLTSFVVGRETSAGTALTGSYAHFAAWSAALSANEMAALCAGANPLTIRRGDLQGYFPFDGDLRNLAQSAYRLTPNAVDPIYVDGPTIAPPPRRNLVALFQGATQAGVTGSGGVTVAGPAVAGAGTVAPPGVTGAGGVVLAGPVVAGAGVIAPPPGVTGAGGVVLAGPVVAGAGAVTPPAAAASSPILAQMVALSPVVASLDASPPVVVQISGAAPVVVLLFCEGEAMLSRRYFVGEGVQMKATFATPAGVAVAATGVALSWRTPSGAKPPAVTMTAGGATGVFLAPVTLGEAGRWAFKAIGTDPTTGLPAVCEQELIVAESLVA